MGYVTGYSACAGCGRLFTYNPVRVPSVVINGSREPICQSCVNRVNPLRRERGLPEIVPAPDAYEACEEGELP